MDAANSSSAGGSTSYSSSNSSSNHEVVIDALPPASENMPLGSMDTSLEHDTVITSRPLECLPSKPQGEESACSCGGLHGKGEGPREHDALQVRVLLILILNVEHCKGRFALTYLDAYICI